jgi:hypothetical protein
MNLRFIICMLCAALAGTLHAAPGWDPWGIHHQSSELLDTGDFKGLEDLAAQLKKNGYDIQQEQPELGGFYGGIKMADDAPVATWPDRLKVIQSWRAAFPTSLSAKIAEIYWYLDYPPGVLEAPTAPGVLPEPGNMPAQINCRQKAEELLKAVPAASVDDTEYYVCWLKLCTADRNPPDEMWGYFKQAVPIAPQYMSLYLAACDYLLPTVRGEQGNRSAISSNGRTNGRAPRATRPMPTC